MFPLKNRKIVGYKFGDKTFYNDFHIGVDYAKEGDEIFMPFTGRVTAGVGLQGGNTLYIRPDDRPELIRMLHLQKVIKRGQVKEGELIGIVGHTGLVSPPGPAGSHTHIDISKNGKLELNNTKNFLDPEKYDWKGEPMAQIKTQSKGSSRRIVLEAATEKQWIELCAVYGKDPNESEEKVRDA